MELPEKTPQPQKRAFNLMELVRGGLGEGVEIDLTPEIEPVDLNGEFPTMEFTQEKPTAKVSLTETPQGQARAVKQEKQETQEPDNDDEPEKTALSASKGAKAGVLVLDMLNSTIASLIGKKPRQDYKWERGEKKELEEALKIYIESSDFQVSPGWALFLVLATMVGGTMSEAYQDGQEAKGRAMKRDEPAPEPEPQPKPSFQPRQPQTHVFQQPETVEKMETTKKPFKMGGKTAGKRTETNRERAEASFYKLQKKLGTRPRIRDVFDDLGGDVSMTTTSNYIKNL